MSSAQHHPIKVAHVITRFIRGGAQENTLLTVQGLAAEPGYRAWLITGPGLGPEGDFIPEARDAGVEVIVVDSLRREMHPRLDVAAYRELRRLFGELEPDIVHTHSSKAGILGRKAAKDQRVPHVVHTIHGLPFHDYERPWRNWLYTTLERRAAAYTDLLISVADAMTAKAVAAGLAPREKFVTVYSGMDVAPFLNGRHDCPAVRRELGIDPNAPVIGVVARISPLKGHEFVIRAAPGILAHYPHARFLFVGDGHIRDEMEQLAESFGVRAAVVFAGLRDYREIPELIASMDLVVHASLREGLARVLPQALLSGVPVVSYDVDGAREVVVNGETGWLVEPESVDGLEAAVLEVLGDLGRAGEMAEVGREICRRRFPARVMVEAILGQYRRLLEEDRSE
ncbi:MAG: glycosyltransferase family 4 protein [Planctomycetota bacterium]